MDFEPYNFPALVTSVIRSNTQLAEPLRELFAAYARNEDWDEIWAGIDSKYHQTLRLILDDLNGIEDPISLDQAVQVLLESVDQALITVEEEAMMADALAGEESKAVARKARKKSTGKKKKTAKKAPTGKKKKSAKAAKKTPAAKKKKSAKAAKKTPAAKKKKTAKAAKKAPAAKKKKSAKAGKKKAAKPATRSSKKPTGGKKAKARKKTK